MLQVSGLSKSYGSRLLFSDVTFTVGQKEVVGFVGRNGCGKSTLFKAILGQEEADSGQVIIPKGYRIGSLDQHISFSKSTLIEECAQCLPEDQRFDHFRAEKILFGLGFNQLDLARPPGEFSGGYQLRINLTKALLSQPDLLLLDEPTNYLDILSLRWMKSFLATFSGEAIVITHDREFMDSVATHIMGLHRGGLRKVKGKTHKYYEQLKLEEEIHEKTRVNRQQKLAQMQDFVEKFRAKASKASQAQSIMKKIEKMDVLEQLDAEQVLGFHFNFKNTPAKRLLEVSGLSFGYEEDQALFEGLSFELKLNECIGVIGKNGKGKTTLLNVIAAKCEPWSGSISCHPSVELGYYEQTNRKNLDPQATIIEEIEKANIDLDTTQVRSICGAMMFPGDNAKKKIKVLSGGEQGRVLLGKILAHSNNVLLLDEPSNHLDMESVDVMIEEISDFPGGSLIVTHNEKMLRKLCDRLIVFDGEKVELFNGNYSEFLRKRGWSSEKEGGSKKGARTNNKKLSRQERAEKVIARSARLKPLKKQVDRLEKEIETQEAELERLNLEVYELVQQEEAGKDLQELYKKIGQIQINLERHYTQLESLLTSIDKINQSYR